jgi:GT2 family glycosyltransferase
MADEPIVICMPWRTDHGQRERVFNACVKRWAYMFPDGTTCLGTDPSQPFNRSAARNNAVAELGRLRPGWDYAVLADADVMVYDRQQIIEAVRMARRTGHMVFAHTWRAGLSEEQTEKVLAGEDPSALAPYPEWDANTFSGCYVVPRALWETLGGFDERYQAWGLEDVAFHRAAGAMGGVSRIDSGTIYHLWHPRSRAEQEENPYYHANHQLWQRYLDAGWDRGAMAEVLAR